MRRAKRGISVFFIALIISFMVLSSIFLLVLIFSKTENADKGQEDIPYISEYSPGNDESLAILLMGCEMPQSLPDFTVLVYYDAPKGIIYPIALPSATVSTSHERRDTLQGHYDYSGMHGCMNGVKALLSIELDRYARFQKTGIANIVDLMGGIPYNLQVQKSIGSEQLLKGEQLLDGRRVSSLLFAKTPVGISKASDTSNPNDIINSPEPSGITNTDFQSELLSKLIEGSFNSEFVVKYDGFISSIFSNCETNLNQYDFAKRQTGFLNRLKSNSLIISEISVTGSYNNDFTEFYISNESLSEIREIVG